MSLSRFLSLPEAQSLCTKPAPSYTAVHLSVLYQEEPAAWSWEEPPTAVVTVQDKIRAYRDSRARVSESEPAPEPDFFSVSYRTSPR